MKVAGESIVVRLLPAPDDEYFILESVLSDFIPRNVDEVPWNALSLDGTSDTLLTIDGTLRSILLDK